MRTHTHKKNNTSFSRNKPKSQVHMNSCHSKTTPNKQIFKKKTKKKNVPLLNNENV